MLKFSFVLLLVLCVQVQSIKAQEVFKIGAESLIPFEFVQNGNQTGINVQLVDTIFKRMNIPYQIIFGTESERSFDMIKNGKVDAILSISYKEDRTDLLWYPEGFENDEKPQNFMWASEYVFFSKKSRVAALSSKSLDDISKEKLKVGVIKGVSYSEEFWKTNIVTVESQNDEDNYKKLLAGEIDLYLTDKTIGRFTLKSMGLTDQISYLPQRVLSKPYTMAFSKKSKHSKSELIKKQFFIELEWTKRSGAARKLFMEYLQN